VTHEEAEELAARISGGADYPYFGQSRGSAAETRSGLMVSLLAAKPLVARLLHRAALATSRT
jgi:hypothetical protein